MTTPAMTPETFRTIREGLGLEHRWIATQLDIAVRTVERWESGASRIPPFAVIALQEWEQEADQQVEKHLDAFVEDDTPMLFIEDDGWPPRWQRAVAFRVRQHIPDLTVQSIPSEGEAE